MTLEEQDAILGRLARQYREVRGRVVALQAKAHSVGQMMEVYGRELQERRPRREIFAAREFFHLTQEALLELVGEIEQALDTAADLHRRLTEAGHRPAD